METEEVSNREVDNPAIKSVTLRSVIGLDWKDFVLVVVLAAGAVVGSLYGAARLDPAILSYETEDVWFDADVARVFENMTNRESSNHRADAHPLFSILTFPIVKTLIVGLGLWDSSAVRLIIALTAGLSIAAIYLLLRLMKCKALDAALFTLLFCVSAAGVFWFTIPETYSFGSLTILIALITVALLQYREFSVASFVGLNMLTMSITITNGMAGVFATLARFSVRQSIQIIFNAFSLTVLLWAVEKTVFPSSNFFLGMQRTREAMWVAAPSVSRLLTVAKVYLFHSIVMPDIKETILERYYGGQRLAMTIQTSSIASGTRWGVAAAVLWGVLLVIGVCGLYLGNIDRRIKGVVASMILGQFVLHSVYGLEIFLYSAHYAVLLIIIAALSVHTFLRHLSLCMVAILVVLLGLNNFTQFGKAADFVQDQVTERYKLKTAMTNRALDPWPRATSHVVLAAPGSNEVEKSYHEPGGSFSPVVGSFGISVWVTDAERNLVATSDSIPLDGIQQKFVSSDDSNLPGIFTETGYFQTLWSIRGGGKGWSLSVTPKPGSLVSRTQLVIRSAGPAGGPIRSLHWDGRQLLINNRWSVDLDPGPIEVQIGDESRKGWVSEKTSETHIDSAQGWGYARLSLDNFRKYKLIVNDRMGSPPRDDVPLNIPGRLKIDLPDKEFVTSLNAQIAHLAMGIVGDQVRPGDPMNYPTPWLRDEAYVVAALARTGQTREVERISKDLAEKDFFGVSGSETDAPGLAIWALVDGAMQKRDIHYNRWLWPLVHRKAEKIISMLSTDKGVSQPVNAIRYRALVDAAWLANQVGQTKNAIGWLDTAARLRSQWKKELRPPDSNKHQAYVNSIWPSWIGDSKHNLLRTILQERWTSTRRAGSAFRKNPSWSQLELAEVHQWLFLGDLNKIWTTLREFWDHQASPGLFTWWEGVAEKHSFRRWDAVRGWVNLNRLPVTPDYLTAAQMLLLQLEMLAYADESNGELSLVVGAGVPAAWLDRSMSVSGLATRLGVIDWQWKEGRIQVTVHGPRCEVRLGRGFPPGTPIKVSFLDSL